MNFAILQIVFILFVFIFIFGCGVVLIHWFENQRTKKNTENKLKKRKN